MNSKELTKRAVHFGQPERTPLLYFNSDFDKTDVKLVGYTPILSQAQLAARISEWGFQWQSHDNTMGQPKNPPVTDWDCFANYRAPDPLATGRFDKARAEMAQYSDRYLVGDLGITGFNIVTFIRGFEDTLMDLCSEPETIEPLIDMVMDYETALAEQFGALGADCIYFGDDWGTQNSLMIDPGLWRRVFKPRYKKQFDRVHQLGMDVFFHSCGYLYDIIPDLIEIGVDIFNFNQPDVMGIERLSADFGGKTCFCCPVDHQTVAINGTKAEISDYVKRLSQNLGSFGGGFIGYIEEYSSIGMSGESFEAIKQAFRQA